jgi:hypothetical protein
MTTYTPVFDQDISLVAALWHFIENSGTTEEFCELRSRVREDGALYDAAPTLREALTRAFATLERIADLLHYEDGQPVTALDARDVETIYADAISELASIESLIRQAGGQP